MINDPLGDMLTRIRNAQMRRRGYSIAANACFSFFFNVLYVVALTWCALELVSGAMSYGTLMAVLQLVARIQVKPLRAAPEDKDVLVRTEIVGRGDPIQLDYRLEKTPGDGAGWKIYNLNVLGVWLVETYRGQFAQEINAKGIDGLIDTLVARNKSNADSKS